MEDKAKIHKRVRTEAPNLEANNQSASFQFHQVPSMFIFFKEKLISKIIQGYVSQNNLVAYYIVLDILITPLTESS